MPQARLEMELALVEAAATACGQPYGCEVLDYQRAEILPGIVHYSALLQVGPGEHDRIGLHRVVRENREGYPLKTKNRIFLQHGDAKNFVGMFLPTLYSSNLPADFGLAIYLARANVDVWGIDQGWTLLTYDVTDFSFLADWGLQRQVDDLRTAIAVAREVRALNGGSDDRFNLLGYSSGAMTGYALINEEAALPKRERLVQGFVAADMAYISTDPDWTATNCDSVLYDFGPAYESGQYLYDAGFSFLGALARDHPDDPTPLGLGLTNLETALFFGTAPLFGNTPVHYLAGEFDETGLATGLQYVSTDAWLDFMISARDLHPTLFWLDYSEVLCGMDTPFDDNLADVTIPVLNWGTAGGIGPYGSEMATVLGSRDWSEWLVSTHPPEDVLLDFAHIDLFMAHHAPELAWEALRDWIRAHK
jgi:hypothetical protein